MRIAVLSDIHGNLLALEAVVRHLRTRGTDAVVNLGDSLSGPLLPLETAQFLMAQGWTTIAGNHERQLLTQGPAQWGASDAFTHARLTGRELDWLAGQPASRMLDPEVMLCHGTPHSDLEPLLETLEPPRGRSATAGEVAARLGPAGAAVVLCGHTHLPRLVRTGSGQLVVNPGSVGLPAWEHPGPPPVAMESGSPDARYALVECRGGKWQASLVAVPYDHEAMADLARDRHRPDWEAALRTGYLA
jgi:predicted phosphodiesterase